MLSHEKMNLDLSISSLDSMMDSPQNLMLTKQNSEASRAKGASTFAHFKNPSISDNDDH